MHHAHYLSCTIAPDLGTGFGAALRPAPELARAEFAFGNPSARDCAFIALQNAYRPHGGLSRLHGLNAGGCVQADGLFGFRWYDAVWVPRFQFASPGHALADGPQRVVAELGRSFDGWALAGWFVAPNSWLASRPIECLDSRLPDVLEAARADRPASAD
jgi:hypothetical protein